MWLRTSCQDGSWSSIKNMEHDQPRLKTQARLNVHVSPVSSAQMHSRRLGYFIHFEVCRQSVSLHLDFWQWPGLSAFGPRALAAVEAVKSLTGLSPPCSRHKSPIWKKCSACQRGGPVRSEYRSISYPIWGPWSHVLTCIALLATSPGHIGDRKEVAEQKHSRCSSSVGHRGSQSPQHLAPSLRSEAERWCSATAWLSDRKSRCWRIGADPLLTRTVSRKRLDENFINNLLCSECRVEL